MKKKYFTKCDRKFFKSSTADVTGYAVDLNDPEYDECKTCPFKIEVKKGYPAVFDHWECRAGSERPNHENNWRGNHDDKTGIHVLSLDYDYLMKVIMYCDTHDDITGSFTSSDEKDCRRCVSIGFSQNKKGMAAKQQFLKLFFGVEIPGEKTEEADTVKEPAKFKTWNKKHDQELMDRYLGQNGRARENLSALAEWFCVSEQMILDELLKLGIKDWSGNNPEPTLIPDENAEPEEKDEVFSVKFAEKSDKQYEDDKLLFLYKADKSLSDLAEIFGKDWTKILKQLRELGEDPAIIESDFIALNQKRTYELSKINKNFQIGIDPAMLDDNEWEKVCSNAEAAAKASGRKRRSMFNSEFSAELRSVSSKTYYVLKDGMKTKEAAYKLAIVTDDIDYEELEKEAPYMHHLITYENMMQFRSINFGEIYIKDLTMKLSYYNESGDLQRYPGDISSVKITNFSVLNKANIPTYVFVLEVPKTINGNVLLTNLKSKILVELIRPASLFDDVEIKGVK